MYTQQTLISRISKSGFKTFFDSIMIMPYNDYDIQ